MNNHFLLKRAVFVFVLLSGFILFFGARTHGQDKKKQSPKITYDDHVKPILRQKCFSCHNADKKSGDLDMTNFTNLMQGGGSGEVIEPGDSSGSHLYSLITHQDEPFMPPESPKISDKMIETIRQWIDGGVLESTGSKARGSNKPSIKLALKTTSAGKPAVMPMPARLVLEPVTHTSTTTAVSALATSPWAPLAAVAGQKQILLYSTKTLQLLGALPYPEGVPRVLRFSRNGGLLLAGGGRDGANGRVIVWNVKTGQRVFQVGDELDTVLAADISSDQTMIALGGPRRVVRIYSTETGRLLHELRKHTDWIYSLEFSPDSVLLATGDRNGGLFVWEAWTGREYLTLKGHGSGVTGVSWRSDSNVLASCSADSTVRLWEMENGGQIKKWGAHGGGAESIEFARDGRILTCGRDRIAKLWDQNGGQQRAFEAFGDLALRATFCDETNRAIAGDWTGDIRVWNAADGNRVGQLASNPPRLAQRLEEAVKQLAAQQAKHKPLATAYQVARAAADKATADLAAAQKTMAEVRKRSESMAATAKSSQQVVAKEASAHQAASKVVAALQPAVPLLKEAADKAQQAAAKLTADKEAAAALAKIKALAENRAALLETNLKLKKEKTAALQKAKQQLASAKKVAAEAAAVLTAARGQVEKLAPPVKPATEKAAQAKAAVEAAASAVAAARQQENRWKDEIAFFNKIQELTQQREAAMASLAARQTEHAKVETAAKTAQAAANQAKAKLTAAQNATASAQKQAETTTATVGAAKKDLAQAAAGHQAAAKAITVMEGVIASLGQAAAKAQEAAAKSGGEKQLAEAAANLKKLAGGKTAQLGATRKDLAVKAKTMEASKQKLAAAEKATTTAATALVAVRKRTTELTVAAKPLEQKAAAAQKVASASAQTVAAAQQEVNRIRTEIATAQGLTPGKSMAQANAAG